MATQRSSERDRPSRQAERPALAAVLDRSPHARALTNRTAGGQPRTRA